MGMLKRTWDAFEDRTGLGAITKQIMTHPVPPTPGATGWMYVFGAATLTSFIVAVVSGIPLASQYVSVDRRRLRQPAVDHARGHPGEPDPRHPLLQLRHDADLHRHPCAARRADGRVQVPARGQLALGRRPAHPHAGHRLYRPDLALGPERRLDDPDHRGAGRPLPRHRQLAGLLPCRRELDQRHHPEPLLRHPRLHPPGAALRHHRAPPLPGDQSRHLREPAPGARRSIPRPTGSGTRTC